MSPARDAPPSHRLWAEDLRFRYADSRGFGLHLPQLELKSGDTLVLTGPSGTGKTTLLRLLAGLLTPHAGRLGHDQLDTRQLSPAAQRDWRLRHAGLIFQDFALLDYLTSEENALLPTRFLGLHGEDLEHRREHARHLADALDLTPHWTRPVSGLSQGERQRVAVVRALAHQPAWLFADEPTAALDPHRRDLVIDLLQRHTQDQGALLVLITHDPDVRARFPLQLNVEDLRDA